MKCEYIQRCKNICVLVLMYMLRRFELSAFTIKHHDILRWHYYILLFFLNAEKSIRPLASVSLEVKTLVGFQTYRFRQRLPQVDASSPLHLEYGFLRTELSLPLGPMISPSRRSSSQGC